MSKAERIVIGLTTLGVLIAGASLALYVHHEQAHGEIAMSLTATVLFLVFIASCGLSGWAVYRNLQDAHRATDLEAQIVKLKDEQATQIAGLEKQHKEQIDQARQEYQNNEAGLLKLKQAYWCEAKAATERAELLQQEITAKDSQLSSLVKEIAERETRRLENGVGNDKSAIADNDPRIHAEFSDDRGATVGVQNEGYITLVNRGGSDALNVCIEPIKLKEHVIKFPQLAYSISPGQAKHRYPDITTNENRTAQNTDLFLLLFMEYTSLGDNSIHELALPLVVTYQDVAHNLYEGRCELVFNLSAHLRVRQRGQNGSIAVVTTRNHKFKKLAVAVG